ncbi:DUF6479 family protein [Streptacidiphilus sp. N1-3]
MLSAADSIGTSTFTPLEALAAGAAIGSLIVIVLILAFVLGSRRKEREPEPEAMPLSATRDAWATPASTPGHAPRGDATAAQHVLYLRP